VLHSPKLTATGCRQLNWPSIWLSRTQLYIQFSKGFRQVQARAGHGQAFLHLAAAGTTPLPHPRATGSQGRTALLETASLAV